LLTGGNKAKQSDRQVLECSSPETMAVNKHRENVQRFKQVSRPRGGRLKNVAELQHGELP
jgi:hypothetical protein